MGGGSEVTATGAAHCISCATTGAEADAIARKATTEELRKRVEEIFLIMIFLAQI
jgi:hypothetical protein